MAAQVRAVHVSLGEAVSRGQIIMALDTTESALTLSNLEEQLALKKAERRSLDLQRSDAIRQARSRRDLLRIDLESREAVLYRMRRLGERGGVSAQALLEAELDVKRTRVEIEQIDAEIVSLAERREADLERLELDLSILDKQRAEQARRVAMSTLTAPRDGIVTGLVRDVGAFVSEGQALATIAGTGAFRVEAGVSDFYAPQLEPGQRALSAMRTMFSAELRARNIALEIDAAPDLPLLWMDRNQMDQVLMNVIKNAAEAIERDGKIEIAVRRDGERVTLVVSDTGCGLDEHVRGNLFKPFFTTKRHGQGLGLMLVKEILTQHGFAYWLEPAAAGARFRIEMPIGAASPLPAEPMRRGASARDEPISAA